MMSSMRFATTWAGLMSVRRRADLMDQFKGDVGGVLLRSADKLIVNRADNGRVIVIEYEIRGTTLATAQYENRFCSIIELGKAQDHAPAGLYGLARGVERPRTKSPMTIQAV